MQKDTILNNKMDWENRTPLVEACPSTRWGFSFKSINLLSTFPSASASVLTLSPSTGTEDNWWFWWFSLAVSFGGSLWSLVASFWSRDFGPSSSRWPALSRSYTKSTPNGKSNRGRTSGEQTQNLPSAETQTSTLCLNRRYLPWVLFPPTCTTISHCKQRELPSTSQ